MGSGAAGKTRISGNEFGRKTLTAGSKADLPCVFLKAAPEKQTAGPPPKRNKAGLKPASRRTCAKARLAGACHPFPDGVDHLLFNAVVAVVGEGLADVSLCHAARERDEFGAESLG